MDNQTNNNFEHQGTPPQQQGTPPQQHGTPPQQWGTPPQQWGTPPQQQQYGAPWAYTTPTPQIHNTGRPKRRFRNFMKTALTTVSFIRGILAILLLFMLLALVGSLFAEPVYGGSPITPGFSVIPIEGSIVGERTFGDVGYDHEATLKYIRALANNPNDRGILLYMNTPGGTIYHSDELRLALLEYKETSGRPVYAYMAEVCASGGYWISMAADKLIANRMTITGSIGVVSTYFDTSELFENLGIRTVVIDTGEHKSMGAIGTEITPGQETVVRSMIYEYQEFFVQLVSDGRNLDIQAARNIADGRVYTATQAYKLGLIDDINGWDSVLTDFERLTGVTAFYPDLAADTSFFGALTKITSGILPRSEADIAISAIEALPRGVPLVIAPDLVY